MDPSSSDSSWQIHESLALWCETPITAHADLVELASDADLLNTVDTDEHEQRLTETRGVIEAQRRHAARLRGGLGFKPRLVH